MNQIKTLGNEDGYILMVSLIILVLATMIGIAASTTASIELQISGSDKRHAENFYKAEAAAMAGASALQGTPDTLLEDRKYIAEGTSGDEITLPKKASCRIRTLKTTPTGRKETTKFRPMRPAQSPTRPPPVTKQGFCR